MTVYGDSAGNPPEVNYYTLTSGDHAASMTAAAASYQGLADALSAEMALMQTNAAMTATAGWQGTGGTAMLLSASQLSEIINLSVAWLQQASMEASEIAAAYRTAESTMIPGPVADSNRAEQVSLVASNVIGQNTPAIIALDTQYFGHYWPQNASIMAAYEAAVTAALAALATPPPLAPMAADPAAPLAGVAQAAAQAGTTSALQASANTMTETADATGPTGQAASAPTTTAGEGMSAMATPLGMLGQFSGLVGQGSSMAGQLPQLLGSAVQLPTGLLGPLASMDGLGGAGGAAEPVAATLSQTSLPPGGLGAGGAGGGGVGMAGTGMPGTGVVSSSFTRPASSFNPPTTPKLPSGWSNVVEPPDAVAGSTQPSAMGTGGLYGAPAAMGRDAAASSEKPTRTMQLTARPAADRGDSKQN
jgi:PPE-repeat protein